MEVEMKKILLICICCLIILSVLRAENNENTSQSYHFYDYNAFVLNPGVVKYSVFSPASVGLCKNLDISAHPIMLFLSPSVELKYHFDKKQDIMISSYHGINYPTILLSVIARKGTGGVISPEFDIPQMVAVRNGIMATTTLGSDNYLTGRLGFEFAINNSVLEPGTSVDLPVIAPRSAVYYNNVGFNLAISNEGRISSIFNYLLKCEVFAFPFISEKVKREYEDGHNSLFFELTGNLVWKISGSSAITPGFKLCYGDYPFGTKWHLLPSIDFTKWIF
jgi:hypothetical protein